MADRISRRTALTTGLVIAGGATLLSPAAQASSRTDRRDPRADVSYIDVAAATLWVEPATARDIDAPSLANPVDLRAWTSGMSLAQRRWLVGKLETQALYGQEVTILETSGDWAHVAVHSQPTPRHELGYPGWMPLAQLTTAAAVDTAAPVAIVKTATTWLCDDAELGTQFMEISYATRLPVREETGDAVRVATASHGEKWLAATDVTVHDADAIPAPTADDLARDARLFLGLPYLWAGVSGFGFDCSGFTHALYAAYGVTIPRDADAQLAEGAPVDEPAAADLLFYGTDRIHHVGMHIGDGQLIDARTNSDTAEQTIEIVPVAEHPYAHEYAGAVRYLA